MTKVSMMKKGDDYIGFEIEGHSGYAQIGYDIVCAAVSTLAQATLMGIASVARAQHMVEQRDAFLKVVLSQTAFYNKEMALKTQTLLQTMALSLDDIAYQYKEFLQVCTISVDVI
ncbi:MAG: ribosomal-processing cysteine protease Prp [Clostridia bacterium]|nr:ribosomal-processing cysteine protease Prp [Clostridia bacterium]